MIRRTAAAASQREQQVYQALVQAAQRGDKAPTNWQLAELCGCESMATGARLVANLEARGLITVERPARSSRIVTIVASGQQTASCDDSRVRRRPINIASSVNQRTRLRRELGKDTARRNSMARPELVASAKAHAARHHDVRKLSATALGAVPIDHPCPELAAPAREDDPRPPAFSREPCHRCGARGDLGCAHQAPFVPLAVGESA